MKLLTVQFPAVLMSVLVAAQVVNAQSELRGMVYDVERKSAIAYATVMIPGKGLGAVCNDVGEFGLLLTGEVELTDTVQVSSIGYTSKHLTVKEMMAGGIIYLVPKIQVLQQASVYPFRHALTIGKATTDLKYLTGWIREQIGGEIGRKFSVPHSLYKMEKLSFGFYSGYDTVWLRLHVRRMVDTLPHEELLEDEIILTVVKEKGIVEFDLTAYNLVFDEQEICISFELLKRTRRKNTRQHTNMAMITGAPPGNTYLKSSLQAAWIQRDRYEMSLQVALKY